MFQKTKPYLIGLMLLLVIGVPDLLVGYASLSRAEEARALGRHQRAADEYIRAAQLLFWRSDLYEPIAVSSARAGDYQTAVAYFQRAKELSASDWVWFCFSSVSANDLDAALQICNAGAQTQPSAPLYTILAELYRDKEDWLAEKDALEKTAQLDSQDAYAAYRLALLTTLYAPEAALPELVRAATLNPEADSATQTLRAALAIADQQRDPSVKKIVIGQALGLTQEWKLAKVAFEQAIALDSQNAEAQAWLGEAKQQTGQDGRAELDRALTLDGASANIRALRALYWNRQGKYQQALAESLLAVEYAPNDARWRAALGEAYVRAGDLVAALTAYQKATELAPQDALYWRLLSAFCADNEAQVEAIGLPAALRAYEISPNDPAVLDALGYSYYLTAQYLDAEKALTRAVEIAPHFYAAQLHLALTYLVQGNRAAAYDSFVSMRDAADAGAYAQIAADLLQKYFQ